MDANQVKDQEWIKAETSDGEIEQARQDIAQYYPDLGDHWYEEEQGLDKLGELLAAGETRQWWLNQLDQLQDGTDNERKEWYTSLANELRYDEPVKDEAYGMYYRYDRGEQVYLWKAEADLQDTGKPWMTQEEADAQMVAWQQSEEGIAAGPWTEQEEFATPTWDENWKMFYKIGQGGAYQYAFSTTGDANGEPRATWYDYQDVPAKDPEAAAGRAGPEAAEGAAPELPPSIEAALEDAAGEVFAAMDVEALAGLDLSEDAIGSIADAVAAHVASGIEE